MSLLRERPLNLKHDQGKWKPLFAPGLNPAARRVSNLSQVGVEFETAMRRSDDLRTTPFSLCKIIVGDREFKY